MEEEAEDVLDFLDPEMLARAIAALCGSITAHSMGEKDPTRGIAYADMYLEYIDPLSMQDREEFKFTLSKK